MKKNPFENYPGIGTVKSLSEEYEHPSESDKKDVLEEEIERPSFFIYYFIGIVIILVFAFKLLNLQVAQGAKFQYLAEGNRIRSKDIPAPRGIIYDKKGKVISKNVASFNLEIVPADLPQEKEERQNVYQKLNEISQIPAGDTEAKIEHDGLFSVEPIVLKENLPRDEALGLIAKYSDTPGVEVAARPNREYDSTSSLGHFLGYIGKISAEELEKHPDYKMTSWIGKSGLELNYEEVLKGEVGKEQIEVDSRGRIQRSLASVEPKPGNNIHLGIDLEFEKAIAEALEEKIKEKSVTSGVVVAIDPRDGTVLGMVSAPYYDNNLFAKANPEEYKKLIDDPNKPLVNRAVSGIYPSGSTIKPFIASAGLQEKIISENTTINDPGEIKVGEWVFPDWKAHGSVAVRKAIAESCDVFFYSVGGGWDKIKGLGADKMKEYLDDFGFGKKTGIDIPGEVEGLIPTPDWKKKVKKEAWYLGDNYHLAIGQGDFLTTPIQLANATAAVANGGELLKPHLVTKETDSKGNTTKEISKDVVKSDFIDSYNNLVVREGMRQTITSGSARSLNDLPFTVAGKTGTAQFDNTERLHAWFTAFAPYENPEIALVVLVEAGGEGSDTAVPVARKILEWFFANK